MVARVRKPKTSWKVAIGYLRVSTSEQKLGPAAQRADLERWATKHAVRIAGWCQDLGVSGAAPLEQRTGMLGALRAAREHGAGAIVANARDRFARDVVLAAQLDALATAQACRLVITSDDYPPPAVENRSERELRARERRVEQLAQDAASETERLRISIRTRKALAAKQARGELTGKPPFGMRLGRDGVHLEPAPGEQRAIARALELRGTDMALRAIVAQLNAEEAACRGKQWHLSSLVNLLRRHETD